MAVPAAGAVALPAVPEHEALALAVAVAVLPPAAGASC